LLSTDHLGVVFGMAIMMTVVQVKLHMASSMDSSSGVYLLCTKK